MCVVECVHVREWCDLKKCFLLYWLLSLQDNVERAANHRQADMIGPSFQQSTNQNSPSHQGQ